MNLFENYINKIENQDLKNFTKYLDTYELAMLEMHFLSFAKEQICQHVVSGSLQINWDDVYEEANHRSPEAFYEYVKHICNER